MIDWKNGCFMMVRPRLGLAPNPGGRSYDAFFRSVRLHDHSYECTRGENARQPRLPRGLFGNYPTPSEMYAEIVIRMLTIPGEANSVKRTLDDAVVVPVATVRSNAAVETVRRFDTNASDEGHNLGGAHEA